MKREKFNKKFVGLLVATMILGGGMLVGCGDSSSNSENDNKATETSVEEKGTRSNPYLIGETGTASYEEWSEDEWDLNITVQSVIRGEEANQEIADVNKISGVINGFVGDKTDLFSPEPKEGYEYIIVEVTVEVTDSNNDTAYKAASSKFDFVDGKGAVYKYEVDMMDLPNEIDTEVYVGGSVTGNVITQVKIDDEAPMLKYEDAWFALSK